MKTVLITGASTGIGEALVLSLAQKGFRVYAGVRRSQDGENLKNHAKGEVIPLQLDVTSETDVAAAMQTIAGSGHGLDAVINNAGTVVVGPLEYLTAEELKEQFEVNVFGLHRVTMHALPLLRQNKGKEKGRVLHTSSISGRFAVPFGGPYCASKFAVTALGDSLRRELKPHGIKVCLIEPGPVKTPIWEKSIAINNARRDRFPAVAEANYGAKLNKLEILTQASIKKAVAVDEVVKVALHALTSPCPRARYIVGRDAHIQNFMQRFLPTSWVDFLISKML